MTYPPYTSEQVFKFDCLNKRGCVLQDSHLFALISDLSDPKMQRRAGPYTEKQDPNIESTATG